MKRAIICWIALLTLGVVPDAESDFYSALKLTDLPATSETRRR
ncbi:MAG: hypothetical protein ACYTFW_09100 [Planctomycetota bacterium]|jgi:hypothetical protein